MIAGALAAIVVLYLLSLVAALVGVVASGLFRTSNDNPAISVAAAGTMIIMASVVPYLVYQKRRPVFSRPSLLYLSPGVWRFGVAVSWVFGVVLSFFRG